MPYEFIKHFVGNGGGHSDANPNYCFKKLMYVESGNFISFSSPSSFTLATSNATKNWNGTLEYSTDTSTWNEWDGATTLSADSGVLYMRGSGNTKITGDSENYRWYFNGSNISCKGNIENLLDYATVARGEHPVMAEYCYSHMFHFAGGLVSAPTLSAITLVRGCYKQMFSSCQALTTFPELPATTLAEDCYYFMFSNCNKLVIAPKLPATTLAKGCYRQMFYSCSALTTPPKLPATALAERCYMQMFDECYNLVTLPALPATNLAEGCYLSMFNKCRKIKLSATQTDGYQTPYRIPSSGTGIMANAALTSMFFNTGGTFTDTPEINTTYYTSNTVI